MTCDATEKYTGEKKDNAGRNAAKENTDACSLNERWNIFSQGETTDVISPALSESR